MPNEKSGGPAFPIQEQRAPDGAGLVEGWPGMTLRDWFAGHALAPLIASSMDARNNDWPITITQVAEKAYLFADAMIAARAPKE